MLPHRFYSAAGRSLCLSERRRHGGDLAMESPCAFDAVRRDLRTFRREGDTAAEAALPRAEAGREPRSFGMTAGAGAAELVGGAISGTMSGVWRASHRSRQRRQCRVAEAFGPWFGPGGGRDAGHRPGASSGVRRGGIPRQRDGEERRDEQSATGARGRWARWRKRGGSWWW